MRYSRTWFSSTSLVGLLQNWFYPQASFPQSGKTATATGLGFAPTYFSNKERMTKLI